MKPTRLLFILTALAFAGTTTATYGQATTPAVNTYNYKTAIGARFGGTAGLTIRQFVGGSGNALEGIIGVWHDAVSITLLYEKHVPAFNTAGFTWYYGAGGHVAFQTYDHSHIHDHNHRHHSMDGDDLGLGVDGILGLEYKVREIPFAFSLDLKPYMEFTAHGDIHSSIDPGLGIKFTF